MMYDFIKSWGRRGSQDQGLPTYSRWSQRRSSTSSTCSYPPPRSCSPEPIINMTSLDGLPDLWHEPSGPTTQRHIPSPAAAKPLSHFSASTSPTMSMDDYVSFPSFDADTATASPWAQVDAFNDAELQMEPYERMADGTFLQTR